jgi:acylphosphatase
MGCIRCIVTGKVQGVWFRASTQRQAQRLGVTGLVRNLPDGAVEVIACGADGAVAQLVEWLHRGPEHARVAAVSVMEWAGPAPADFRTE